MMILMQRDYLSEYSAFGPYAIVFARIGPIITVVRCRPIFPALLRKLHSRIWQSCTIWRKQMQNLCQELLYKWVIHRQIGVFWKYLRRTLLQVGILQMLDYFCRVCSHNDFLSLPNCSRQLRLQEDLLHAKRGEEFSMGKGTK